MSDRVRKTYSVLPTVNLLQLSLVDPSGEKVNEHEEGEEEEENDHRRIGVSHGGSTGYANCRHLEAFHAGLA